MSAHVKHDVRRVFVLGIEIIFMGIVSFFLPFIISTKVPANQVSQFTMISMMAFLLLFVIPMLILPRRRILKVNLDSNVQDVPKNIDNVIRELKVDDLLESLARLESDKEHLSLENRSLKLEIDWFFLKWEQEALDLLYTSPRSAMIIVWLWLKQDIQRLVKQLPLFSGKDNEMPESLGEMLDTLEMNGDIDHEMVVDIKGMEAFRNRVVAGDTPEIDADIAFSFIKQAFDISKNMTKKLSIEQN